MSASVTLYSSAAVAVAVGLSCRESCLKSITSARQSIVVVVCRTVGPVIDDQWMDGWDRRSFFFVIAASLDGSHLIENDQKAKLLNEGGAS